MTAKRDAFGDIPTELKYMVFAFLPQRCLKTARLVNKEWSSASASLLFQKANISLLDTDTRNLNTLINGLPGGFLDCIRKLSICDNPSPAHTQIAKDAKVNMHRMLNAMPRNCLTDFICLARLDRDTIGLLLQNQSRLVGLHLSLSEQEYHGLPELNYVRGNLTFLSRLTFTLASDKHFIYHDYAAWFPNMPALTDLEIIGAPTYSKNYFKGWILAHRSPLLRLHRLSLNNLVFAQSASTLAEQIHLPYLRKLSLQSCVNTAPLLRSFAAAFAKLDECALEVFEHTETRKLHDQKSAVNLLRTLERLDSVVLVSHGRVGDFLPDITNLDRVGHTIRYAHVSTAYVGRCYSVEELRQLSTICPNLEVLGINIVDLRDDIDDTEILQDFELLADNGASESQIELRELLKALAEFPKLRTLRIANHPLMSDDFTAPERRYRHSQLAQVMMSFLVNNGSPIQLIVFNPAHSYEHDDGPVMDSSGHTWPIYFYQKATLSFDSTLLSSVDKVIAVPIKRDEIKLLERYHSHII